MAADRSIGPATWAGNIGRVTFAPKFLVEPSEGDPYEVPIPSQQSAFGMDIRQNYNLSSGFNALTVPANATFLVVTLPEGNTQTCTLKGVTGDTGVPLNLQGASLFALATASTPTLGLTAGGTITGVKVLFF